MTKQYRVTLTIEGIHALGGHPELDVLVSSLRDFRDTLRSIEGSLTGGKKTIDLRVVELSHASPATITVEATRRAGAVDIRDEWIARVNQALLAIDRSADIEVLPIPVLKKVRQLSKDVGSKIAALRVNTGEQIISLDLETFRTTDRALNDFRQYDTIYNGRLETVDFHAGANRFVIYPANKVPQKIACVFTPEQVEAAEKAINKRVRVSGVGRFRRGVFFPSLIYVRLLEEIPEDEELPALSTFFGAEPEIVGNVLAEEFVRGRRDDWR